MAKVMKRISYNSLRLGICNKTTFGKVQNQLRKAQQNLKILQGRDPTYADREGHCFARAEVKTKWLESKEFMWRQRSRDIWLKE